MNKKAFTTVVASVAVAGTIAAPAMADETAVTPVEIGRASCRERV